MRTSVDASKQLDSWVKEVVATFWLIHTHKATKSLAWYLLARLTKPTSLAKSCKYLEIKNFKSLEQIVVSHQIQK